LKVSLRIFRLVFPKMTFNESKGTTKVLTNSKGKEEILKIKVIH